MYTWVAAVICLESEWIAKFGFTCCLPPFDDDEFKSSLGSIDLGAAMVGLGPKCSNSSITSVAATETFLYL